MQNPNDMLLACPLAIDKTMCDIGGCGRLPLEPIILHYGMAQFDVWKKPEAMCVLGSSKGTRMRFNDINFSFFISMNKYSYVNVLFVVP